MVQSQDLLRLKLDRIKWTALLFGLVICGVTNTVYCVHGRRVGDDCHPSYYGYPICINHPDGYGCECGSGFHWNTYRCMSTAIDSRLEFKEREPVRYTLLLGKAFPGLDAFTIVFWVNTSNTVDEGTILSYKEGNTQNLLRMVIGQTLSLEIWGRKTVTDVTLQDTRWYHIAWTWSSSGGNWTLYVDGEVAKQGNDPTNKKHIPTGGEFVLGQSSRQAFDFDTTYAFIGDISHLNIWDMEMSQNEIADIKNSCTFMYCGNAVQWAEFRSGTRGAMRMRWPSGIINHECYTEEDVATTCDKHCSDVIGAQCNEETVENLVWERTPVNNTCSVPCPGQEYKKLSNESYEVATRPCYLTEHNEGYWGEPYIDGCISESLLDLKQEFKDKLERPIVNEVDILELCDKLLNHTKSNVYTNPVDIATVIDVLALAVETQAKATLLEDKQWEEGRVHFARTWEAFPSLEETQIFSELISSNVENLLNRKNDVGWGATKPAGVEGDCLVRTMGTFASVLARRIEYHVKDDHVKKQNPPTEELKQLSKGKLSVVEENLDIKVEVQLLYNFSGVKFPDEYDVDFKGASSTHGYVVLRKEVLEADNITSLPGFIRISSFRFKDLARVLPNHDTKTKSKEDNVNTPVIALYVHIGSTIVDQNLTSPILYSLPYLDTFNISNPECVRLQHGKYRGNSTREWLWTRDSCRLVEDHGTSGLCACSVPGVFAITTDMYNDNWDKGERRPILMNFASYVGCTASCLMCLIAFVLHIYFRTSSSTAVLHRNLSLSISLSQLVFMIGIDRHDYPVVCQVFSVLLHYFFLSSYAWLMNEAFNLYIIITYSAHSAHADISDSGSLFRYFVLGWILPGILVGSFVGSQGDGYYAHDMCWTGWENIWLFIGPAVGNITISVMVLIFTAKEHNENSYTKSEKTNKIIMIHSKAVWTQIILVTVCWSFAFLSLKMTDSIIKYLYAMFNCLQGAFFVVYYLLLHEEVRAILKKQKKTRSIHFHEVSDQDEPSLDSLASCQFTDKDHFETMPLETKRRGKLKQSRRRQKARIEASSDEAEMETVASDCEMITSV